MEVLNRSAPFFYNELNRIVKSENTAENTRIPSLVNTYQNIQNNITNKLDYYISNNYHKNKIIKKKILKEYSKNFDWKNLLKKYKKTYLNKN